MSKAMPVDEMSITEARACFGTLVRRAASSRERTTITDHGQAAAVLINPHELAEIEDELAVTAYRLREATGTLVTIPHEEVRKILEAEGM